MFVGIVGFLPVVHYNATAATFVPPIKKHRNWKLSIIQLASQSLNILPPPDPPSRGPQTQSSEHPPTARPAVPGVSVSVSRSAATDSDLVGGDHFERTAPQPPCPLRWVDWVGPRECSDPDRFTPGRLAGSPMDCPGPGRNGGTHRQHGVVTRPKMWWQIKLCDVTARALVNAIIFLSTKELQYFKCNTKRRLVHIRYRGSVFLQLTATTGNESCQIFLWPIETI